MAAVEGADLLAARASAEPDAVALEVDGGDGLTYGEWEARSNAVARGLSGRGVAAGQPVALLFEPRRWVDFATAYLGVLKAGAAAVLLSPGAAIPERRRALAHAGATGLVCTPELAPPGLAIWTADPWEVAGGPGRAPLEAPAPVSATATATTVVYPPAPLARARPRPWSWSETAPAVDGWLVHAWAPGSHAGLLAVAAALDRRCRGVAAVSPFDPDRLGAALARRRAGACGLTPALAAALVASGAPRCHDLASVGQVLLAGTPSAPLGVALGAAFAGATVVDLSAAAPGPGTDGAPGAPVAVSQEGMLWHEQLAPGSFNLPCLVRRYEGPLDVAALERALCELVRRHPPLRTTFELVDGFPHQVVADPGRFRLASTDLAGLPAARRDREVERLVAEATDRPFDLATGPLFEPRLVRLGGNDHVLVVRLHHTVFDDWSVDVVRRELSALYAAALQGAPVPLPEPPTTFADACRRQRARLAGPPGAEQRSWWRRELRGAPLAVQLPIGAGPGRRPATDEPGHPVRVDVPLPLADGVRGLAPRLRATPFMTVLAAFSVLVSRATGQDDLVVATVVAARNSSALEPLVGCFTKKVPLRLRLEGDPTFADLVARTRRSLLGALAHQDLAFDAAVQEGLGVAAAEHGVVPQVAVVVQGETPRRATLTLPGVRVGGFETRADARGERHFTAGPRHGHREPDGPVWGGGIYLGTFLLLSLLEEGQGMALVARGVFDRAAARRLLDDVVSLLAEVVDDPSRRVSQLGARSADGEPDDVVEVRGLRVRRSPLEAALARGRGVAEVAVAVAEGDGGERRLVAYVVAGGDRPPTLGDLRRALWAELPGTVWPADLVVVEALVRGPDGRVDTAALPAPRRDRPDPSPTAALLSAMWGEIRGQPVGPTQSYWQDFSFLDVLVEARQAGLAVGDEHVERSRTPEMLAATLAAAPARRP